jgi:hypothetical protein
MDVYTRFRHIAGMMLYMYTSVCRDGAHILGVVTEHVGDVVVVVFGVVVVVVAVVVFGDFVVVVFGVVGVAPPMTSRTWVVHLSVTHFS